MVCRPDSSYCWWRFISGPLVQFVHHKVTVRKNLNFSNNIWYLPSTVIKFLCYHIWYNMYIHWQIRSYCYIIYFCTQGAKKTVTGALLKILLKPKDGGQVKVFTEPRSDLYLPLADKTDWLQSVRFNWIFWMIFDIDLQEKYV